MSPAANLLLDEHVPRLYQAELRRRDSDILVWLVGDPEAPSRGTSDPAILRWCEATGFVLVTNNRRTMPRHLTDHLAVGQHVPGIVMLSNDLGVGRTIDNLVAIARVYDAADLRDPILYLPVI